MVSIGLEMFLQADDTNNLRNAFENTLGAFGISVHIEVNVVVLLNQVEELARSSEGRICNAPNRHQGFICLSCLNATFSFITLSGILFILEGTKDVDE